jgi:hypothetical protein
MKSFVVAPLLLILPACSGGTGAETDEASMSKAAAALEAKADAEVNASISQIKADATRDAPAAEIDKDQK